MNKNTKKVLNFLLLSFLIVVVAGVFFDQSFELDDTAVNGEVLVDATVRAPEGFVTDGCTLWPNRFGDTDFTEICIEHDIAYWNGGTEEERIVADEKLRAEIDALVSPVGDVMYWGVRVFGHPALPAPWSWGWGHGVWGAQREEIFESFKNYATKLNSLYDF